MPPPYTCCSGKEHNFLLMTKVCESYSLY